MAFPSSICRAQLAVEVSWESAELRCWVVSFSFLIFMVDWVVGEITVPFVTNSWIRFCFTGCSRFFLSFLMDSNLYDQVHLPVILVSQVKTSKCCYQDKDLIAWRAVWTNIVFFESHSIQPISIFFASLGFFFFWNSIPSTRVKHKIIMIIITMININDKER